MSGINKRSNQPNKGLQKKVPINPLYGSFGLIAKVRDAFVGKKKR